MPFVPGLLDRVKDVDAVERLGACDEFADIDLNGGRVVDTSLTCCKVRVRVWLDVWWH